MSGDREFWEAFGAGRDQQADRESATWSAFRDGSLVRLLDAAVVLAHAAANLATVAEQVLAEQRDRLARTAADPATDPSAGSAGDDREFIKLTY